MELCTFVKLAKMFGKQKTLLRLSSHMFIFFKSKCVLGKKNVTRFKQKYALYNFSYNYSMLLLHLFICLAVHQHLVLFFIQDIFTKYPKSAECSTHP